MKKENTKEAIAKKKKRIKISCYVSLVVLNILLFLPMLLRTFVPPEPPKPKDVITVLSCDKDGESISSTFFNGAPQNIMYTVAGNIIDDNKPDEETNELENTKETEDIDNIDSSANTDDTTSNTIGNTDDINNTVDKEETTNPSNNGTQSINFTKNNYFLNLIKDYASATYNETDDTTEVSVHVPDLKGLEEYGGLFQNYQMQVGYFEGEGFTCIRQEFEQ